MDVICDTNIWYNLGNGTIKAIEYKEHNLYGTYLSIDEMSKTPKLLDDESIEVVKLAIRNMIKNHRIIYEPPFFRLLVESIPDFEYDILANDSKILEFTQLIANGTELSTKNKEILTEYIDFRNQRFQEGTKYFSTLISNFKTSTKKKSIKMNSNNSIVSKDFISYIVNSTTNKNLPENFDWSSIELFEKTLAYYFLKLETSEMKIKKNDWYDLAFLVYVRPGQKIWTIDRRLKSLIKEAGLHKYVYDPNDK